MIFTIIAESAKSFINILGDVGTVFRATVNELGSHKGIDKAKFLFSLLTKETENTINAITLLENKDVAPLIRSFNQLTNDVDRFNFANNQIDDKNLKDWFLSLKDGNATWDSYKAHTEAAQKAQQNLAVSSQAAAVGIRILQTALNMAATALIVWGISKAVEWINDQIHATERAIETAKNLASEYANLTSEVESLESELKSIAERIDELNSKPSLSFLEKEELSNLKETNAELQLRLALLKEEQDLKAKESVAASERVYQKTFGKKPVTQSSIDENREYLELTGQLGVLSLETQDISALIIAYEELIKRKSEALASGDTESLRNYSNQIDNIKEILLGASSSLSEYRTQLLSLNNPTAEQSARLDELSFALDSIHKLLAPEQWKAVKFDEVFNLPEFKTAREEVEKLAQSGELTVETFKKIAPELAKALEDAGFSASKSVGQINASVSQAADDVGSNLTNLQLNINDIIYAKM